jgi:hypothetical protein
MKNKLAFLLLLIGNVVFSQSNFTQFSLEAEYGLNHSRNPTKTEFHHIGLGMRYMFNEYWGLKGDYANDIFKSDKIPETQLTSHRFSAQAVYNLGRLLHLREWTGGTVNLLLHSGIGVTLLDSNVAKGIDKAGNFIIGGTLQLSISESLALTGDLSGILNFSQQTNFAGLRTDEFTGKMLNA